LFYNNCEGTEIRGKIAIEKIETTCYNNFTDYLGGEHGVSKRFSLGCGKCCGTN
jgi:hypothetical protein